MRYLEVPYDCKRGEICTQRGMLRKDEIYPGLAMKLTEIDNIHVPDGGGKFVHQNFGRHHGENGRWLCLLECYGIFTEVQTSRASGDDVLF